MNIARLGAAGAAAAIIALGAAGPALATTTPPSTGAGVDKATPSAPTGQKPGEGPSADVNPKFFYGGDTLTFTVQHCAVTPLILDVNHLFVARHGFTETGEGSFTAKETTRKDLVEGKEYKVIVRCGRWTDTFTTKPKKRPTPTPTPTAPTTQPTGVPSGAPQTGDGSSTGGGNTGLITGGVGVVLVGLAGGTFLYTRRRSSAGA
jgi:hypothetical protein